MSVVFVRLLWHRHDCVGDASLLALSLAIQPVDVDVVHESEEVDPYQYTDVSSKPALVFAEKVCCLVCRL